MQGEANRYLRAAYATRPPSGVPLGEVIASAIGLLVFLTIVAGSLPASGAWRTGARPSPTASCSPATQRSQPAIPYTTPSAPRPPDAFSFTSEPHDYIGQGMAESFSRPSARCRVTQANPDYVWVTTETDTENWGVQLAAPHGQTLQPGPYPYAERAAFLTGSAPGLDVGGDGRGCNTMYGGFTISQVVFDQRGELWPLQANFVQQCAYADAPALRGTITYGAPELLR